MLRLTYFSALLLGFTSISACLRTSDAVRAIREMNNRYHIPDGHQMNLNVFSIRVDVKYVRTLKIREHIILALGCGR